MPTYEYQCRKCKKKFDVFQNMTDRPLIACIHCKGKVDRLIGAGAGFIFKGPGFYATDYKKTNSKANPENKEPSGKPDSPDKKS